MKVAIIGAGKVGKAIATSSLRAGHEVTLSASKVTKAFNYAFSVRMADPTVNRW